MKVGTGPERVGSLVVELAARTAIIDGVRIELPLTEFDLLAVLAARPGEIVSHKELAAAAFGEAAPTMAQHELHNRIYRLRKLLDDVEREHKLIENRRGQGYVLHMPPSAVEILDGVSPTAGRDLVVKLDPPGDVDEADEVATSVTAPVERPRLRLGAIGLALLIALAALGGSWFAGYAISRSRHTEPSAIVPEPDHPSDDRTVNQETDRPKPRRDPKKPGQNGDQKKSGGGAQGSSGVVVAQGGSASSDTPDYPTTGAPNSDAKSDKKDQTTQPPPPQPNAQLYHLYNPDSGDHIMTTSSSLANQKQAAGYEASLEGGVFTTQERGTVAISLDSGSAFIYRDAASAPEAVNVTALYKLSSGDDFFYTTSASAANQAQAQGWSRATAGYVAS